MVLKQKRLQREETGIKIHCRFALELRVPCERGDEASTNVSWLRGIQYTWVVVLRAMKERYITGGSPREHLIRLLLCFTDFFARVIGSCFQYPKPFINITKLQMQ